MTITTLTCDKCGAKLTIETDDAAYREKKKTAFEKRHAKCKEQLQKTGSQIRAQADQLLRKFEYGRVKHVHACLNI